MTVVQGSPDAGIHPSGAWQGGITPPHTTRPPRVAARIEGPAPPPHPGPPLPPGEEARAPRLLPPLPRRERTEVRVNPRRQGRGARRGNRVAKQAPHISSRTHPTRSPRPAPRSAIPLSTIHYPLSPCFGGEGEPPEAGQGSPPGQPGREAGSSYLFPHPPDPIAPTCPPAPPSRYPLPTIHYPTTHYPTPVMSYCSAVCVAFALDPLRSDSPWRKLTVTTVCRF